MIAGDIYWEDGKKRQRLLERWCMLVKFVIKRAPLLAGCLGINRSIEPKCLHTLHNLHKMYNTHNCFRRRIE